MRRSGAPPDKPRPAAPHILTLFRRRPQTHWVLGESGDTCTSTCSAVGYTCQSSAWSNGGAAAASAASLFRANVQSTAGRGRGAGSGYDGPCDDNVGATTTNELRPYREWDPNTVEVECSIASFGVTIESLAVDADAPVSSGEVRVAERAEVRIRARRSPVSLALDLAKIGVAFGILEQTVTSAVDLGDGAGTFEVSFFRADDADM